MNDQQIIKKALEEVRKSDIFKDLVKKYKADPEELDLIPICFQDDLEVSARTAHGIIYLNSKLKEKQETIASYLIHEISHNFQQTLCDGPTQGSTDDTYLDNPYEREGFQAQNAFISETKGKPAAEKYTEKLLDHHEINNKKERKEKKEELLQLASSNIKGHKQLPLDFGITSTKIPSKSLKTQIQLMQYYDEAVATGPKEPHRKIIVEKLHPLEQKQRMRNLNELLKTLDDDKNDAAYFWDDSGEFNKESPSDRAYVNPDQKHFKFRDISKNIKIFIKRLGQLNQEDIVKLKRLKMAPSSDMTDFWADYDNGIKGTLVDEPVAIIAEDTDNKRYVGWCLFRPSFKNKEAAIDTFVDRAYRGEGVGTLLMNKVKEYSNAWVPEYDLLAGPWSPTASSFYNKTNILSESDPYDRAKALEEEDKAKEINEKIKEIEIPSKQLNLPFENSAIEMAKKHLGAADRYFGDIEGEHNRATIQDRIGDPKYNPNQLKLKFRDLLKDVEIIVIPYSKFTSIDIEKLSKLTLRQFSSMNTAMTNYPVKELLNSISIIAKDKKTEEYLGWALLTPHKKERQIEIDVFVDRAFRNEGLGSYLINQIKSFVASKYPEWKIEAGSWNKPSQKFYEKVELLPKQEEYKQIVEEYTPEEKQQKDKYYQELKEKYNLNQSKLLFEDVGGEDKSWLFNRK